jgi:hypothetical protein
VITGNRSYCDKGNAMEFIGNPQPINRQSLIKVLNSLGLTSEDSAYIWAIVEVETASVTQGFGFRLDRRPQMLFERHKFREFTDGIYDKSTPEISGPPGNYGTFNEQYKKLEKAIALCEKDGSGLEPALKSASWGVGQVMGFNYKSANFESAENMVESMKRSEESQFLAMTNFLVSNNLEKYLLEKNWTEFAKHYNGKGYWKNKYDIKLQEQYKRFSSGSQVNLEVRAAQVSLFLLGYSPGKIDGVVGPRTRVALNGFRISEGLPSSDDLDGTTYIALCKKANIEP